MKIYGLVNIVCGYILGLVAMPVIHLRTGRDGSYATLAICMALSSVALFIGGTIFFVAGSCCQAPASKAK